MKGIAKFRKIIEEEIEKLSYPTSPERLYNPIKYIMGMEGKRLRPLLVLMAHNIFNENVEKSLPSAIALELFHNFTLLHDDIMDNAPLRRGNPTVHERWNRNIAILSGDVMMIKAYQLLANLEGSVLQEVLDVFNKVAIEVCEGQQQDMDFENEEDVSLVDYMRMIKYKTAVLLAASLQIGAIVAGASKKEQDHLHEFGINMGIAFQLKDDLLDVFGSPKLFGKQLGGDILSNKKTFLYLKSLHLADDETKARLKFFYTHNGKSKTKVNEVKDIFKKLDIKKHAIAIMQSHHIKAMKHLDSIDSENKEPLILFSNKLMERIS